MSIPSTIVTGTAAEPERKPPMADPRDIACVGRRRFFVGPHVTPDDLAAPGALWPMLASAKIGEVVDVLREGPGGFLLVFRVREIDRVRQEVVVDVLDEHSDLD